MAAQLVEQLAVRLAVLLVVLLAAERLAVAEQPAVGLAARLVAVDIVVVGSSFLLSYFLLCARLLWIKLQQNSLCCWQDLLKTGQKKEAEALGCRRIMGRCFLKR